MQNFVDVSVHVRDLDLAEVVFHTPRAVAWAQRYHGAAVTKGRLTLLGNSDVQGFMQWLRECPQIRWAKVH